MDVDTAFLDWWDKQEPLPPNTIKKQVFEVYKDGYEAGMIESLNEVLGSSTKGVAFGSTDSSK
jgi:hypothetical protein